LQRKKKALLSKRAERVSKRVKKILAYKKTKNTKERRITGECHGFGKQGGNCKQKENGRRGGTAAGRPFKPVLKKTFARPELDARGC